MKKKWAQSILLYLYYKPRKHVNNIVIWITNLVYINQIIVWIHDNIDKVVENLEKDSLPLIEWFSCNQMKANPDEFQALAIGKLEAQWAEPVSLTFHSALRKLNTERSIGASHQISVHFGKAGSEKKIFRNRPI